MDAAVKERWIAALAEYKQGRGKLYDGERFCCLGVLCDIELDADWEYIEVFTNWNLESVSAWSIRDPDAPSSTASGALPYFFRESVGISVGQQQHLTNMNDIGKSFKQIAAWIEKNL